MELVWSPEENRVAQALLRERIEEALHTVETETITFRPSKVRLPVYRSGQRGLWWASDEIDRDGTTPRFWNAFGLYKPNSTQKIALEINIKTTTKGRSAGFFARHPATSEFILMHSGVMGGGKEGCTREGLLESLDRDVIQVALPNGKSRQGIVVGSLNDTNLISKIELLVGDVIEFKDSLSKHSEAD